MKTILLFIFTVLFNLGVFAQSYIGIAAEPFQITYFNSYNNKIPGIAIKGICQFHLTEFTSLRTGIYYQNFRESNISYVCPDCVDLDQCSCPDSMDYAWSQISVPLLISLNAGTFNIWKLKIDFDFNFGYEGGFFLPVKQIIYDNGQVEKAEIPSPHWDVDNKMINAVEFGFAISPHITSHLLIEISPILRVTYLSEDSYDSGGISFGLKYCFPKHE